MKIGLRRIEREREREREGVWDVGTRRRTGVCCMVVVEQKLRQDSRHISYKLQEMEIEWRVVQQRPIKTKTNHHDNSKTLSAPLHSIKYSSCYDLK
jgi:hypothetical protein